jgi:hypothetical protein
MHGHMNLTKKKFRDILSIPSSWVGSNRYPETSYHSYNITQRHNKKKSYNNKKKLLDQSEPNYSATRSRSASKLPVHWTGTVRHAPTCYETHARPPRVFGPRVKKKSPPQHERTCKAKKKGNKEESVVGKMAAGRGAANTTNHCLTVSNTNVKCINICTIVGPRAPFRTESPQ